jgi:hypothetical protein
MGREIFIGGGFWEFEMEMRRGIGWKGRGRGRDEADLAAFSL